MIPLILHQIWFGGNMPEDLKRFTSGVHQLHSNRNWSYILWDEQLVNSVFGYDVSDMISSGSNYASISNFIRLHALLKFGGIYLDADCECLLPLDGLCLAMTEAFAATQDDIPIGVFNSRICNAVMGASIGHPWIQWQLQHYDDFPSTDPASGVYLASIAPRDELTVLPRHWFYPFTWTAKDNARQAHPESYLVHHWKKAW